eukprot:6021417-Pleurochrysis_carterae.AAC.1
MYLWYGVHLPRLIIQDDRRESKLVLESDECGSFSYSLQHIVLCVMAGVARPTLPRFLRFNNPSIA